MPEDCPTCGKELKNDAGVSRHHGRMHPEEWENLLWYFVDSGEQSECWEWDGRTGKDGYGKVMVSGKQWRAHRLMYKHEEGGAEGCVLHHCDNRRCCNPHHLYEGDREDNMRDCMERGNRRYVGAKGEENGNATLSEGDVLEIVERVEEGESKGEVAEDYGVSRCSVYNITSGKCWGYLTGRG